MIMKKFTKKCGHRSSSIHMVVTLCLTVAILMTSSMLALANTGNAIGELIITANNSDAGNSAVTVNGEAAVSGRSIFSSSIISTPDGYGAVISLGKTGKIELAPNTTLLLSFDKASMHGELTSGSITVLSAAQSMGVKTLAGDIELNAGETATANASSASNKSKKYIGTLPLWVFAVIVGGIVVGVIIAANHNNNNIPVSPTR